MKIKVVDSYKDSSFEFLGCDCFRSENNTLLLHRENRTSMIVDNSIFENICAHTFSDELKLKFLKRGFAKSKQFKNTIASVNSKVCGYPSYFLIELTKQCNLHCKYCFKDLSLAKQADKIDLKQLALICDYIINFCKNNSINNISFQPWGGEPIICLNEIIFAKKRLESANLQVYCSIQTNGTLLTDKNVKILKENNIAVRVSIDGFEAIQNYQRPYVNGQKTFGDVINGINNLKKHNLNFGILTVITNKSVDYIKEIISYFVNDLGVTNFKFNIMKPNENAHEDMGVPFSKISNFTNNLFNTLVQLAEIGQSVVDVNIRDKLKNLTIRYSGNACKSIGCQGGDAIISFDNQGNIYPCDLTDCKDEVIGNITNEQPLPILIENAKKTRKYYQNKASSACNHCSFKAFCCGGCSSAIKYLKNSEIKVDKVECLINKALYPKLIDLILTKPHVAEILMEKQALFSHKDCF